MWDTFSVPCHFRYQLESLVFCLSCLLSRVCRVSLVLSCFSFASVFCLSCLVFVCLSVCLLCVCSGMCVCLRLCVFGVCVNGVWGVWWCGDCVWELLTDVCGACVCSAYDVCEGGRRRERGLPSLTSKTHPTLLSTQKERPLDSFQRLCVCASRFVPRGLL